MLKKYLCLITICLTAAAAVALGQGTFSPRDADEEQAWRLYNQYKESKRIEAPLEAAIKQKFGEAFEAAVGFGAILGVDWDANVAAKKKVEQLTIERKRQADLIAAWEKKFYWRYGDLRWSGDKIAFKLNYRASSYEIGLPAGTYFLYAMTNEMPGVKAYYDELIKCGVKIECKSKRPIAVKVKPGQSVRGITVGDFWD